MQLFILNRDMKVIQVVSNDLETGFWIDDTGGYGQKIEIVSGCVLGSYDFLINAYAKESKYFQPGNHIVFKDKYSKVRMYTIMRIDGDQELQVSSEDCGLDLINAYIGPWDFRMHEIRLQSAMESALEDSGWEFVIENVPWSDRKIETEGRSVYYSNTDTVLKRLESICASFDVEMEFSVVFDGHYVSKKVVTVKETVSRSKYPTRRYFDDNDIVGLSVTKSIESLYTAVEPTNGDINISNIEYDDGDFFTVRGERWLYARTANKVWSRFRINGKDAASKAGYIHAYKSYSDGAPESVFASALSELKQSCQPQFSYTTNVLDLDATVGDYIQLVQKDKADPVYLEARIISVTNHYSDPSSDECTIGTYRILSPNTSDDILKVVDEVKKQILTKVAADKIDYAISESGTEPPAEDKWTDLAHLPIIKAGQFQWTRRTEYYSDGSTPVSYSIAKSEAARIPKIVETKYFYQLGQNGSIIPSGEWLQTRPAATEDKPYVWTKTVDIYDTPDTRIEHYQVVLDGKQGKNGRSIEKQCTQYYLSTSKDDVVGGSWVDNNVPIRKVNTYIFKREYTKWSDGVEKITNPILDDYHNNQYDSISTLYRNIESDSTQLKTQLGRIEKLESTTSDYESIKEKVNETIVTYSDTIQQFTTTVNGIKEITGVIKTNEDGINIAKPNDPSGLTNQLGSKGFEVTKPTITGNRVTVLKADEQGVYASSFKAVDSMSFGAHKAEFYRMDEIDGSKNVDGTGYFWIGDVK